MPALSRTFNNLHLTINKKARRVNLSICQLLTVQRKTKGFTLIELLVVITIIGILASLILASFSSTQARARDSSRKSDLDALKKALELAKQDTPGGFSYPSALTTLTPDYIKTLPKDPKKDTNYIYQALPPTCINDCTEYTLSACLENNADQQKDDVKNSACTNTQVSYTITSQ